MTAPISPDTAYYYLNDANQVEVIVDWMGTSVNALYYRDGAVVDAPAEAPAADNAMHFTLRDDGSLYQYRHLRADGTYTNLQFFAGGGDGTAYGENGEYHAGQLAFAESTIIPAGALQGQFAVERKTFDVSGALTHYEFTAQNVSLTAALTNGFMPTKVVLTNSEFPAGQEFEFTGADGNSIDRMALLNPNALITDNGAGVISDNGLGVHLVGTDGASLVGTDGGSLVGARPAALVGTDGASLVGTDGASLVGTDGASLQGGGGFALMSLEEDTPSVLDTPIGQFAVNTLAMILGYRSYDPAQNPFGVPFDNAGATMTEAASIAVNDAALGEIESAGDTDWYAVDLVAGQTYTIALHGAANSDGTLADPLLRLLDAEGAELALDDDGGLGNDAQLSFTAIVNGRYFVEATGTGANAVGSYKLLVTQEPSAAYVQAGPTIVNGQVGAVSTDTSIVAMPGGGYAVGFTSRLDGQEDNAYVLTQRVQVAIIGADGEFLDKDGRDGFSTLFIDTRGYTDPNFNPSGPQLTASAGGYAGAFTDIYRTDGGAPAGSGPNQRATGFVGSDTAIDRDVDSITDHFSENDPGTDDDDYEAYTSAGADVAILRNGQTVYSYGHDGTDGQRDDSNRIVEAMINGRNVLLDHTGIDALAQQTSVSALGNRAVVVWTAGGEAAGIEDGDHGVYGAILNPNGSIAHRFHVNQSEEYAQFVSNGQSVTELKDGGFVVVWTSNEFKGEGVSHGNRDVYARVFNADGSARGDEILLGRHEGDQTHATVLATGDGGFVASWVDGDQGIQMQSFTSQGSPVSGQTSVGFGSGQSMALGSDGNIAVAFGSSSGIEVRLMEANRVPTDITLDNNHIDENSVSGSLVGHLGTTDGNAADSFSYELLDSAGGYFYVSGNELRFDDYYVTSPTNLDYEQQKSYQITVRTTDSAGEHVDRTLTIDVDDVNEPVTGLLQTSALVTEGAPIGSVLATLTAADEDDNAGSFTYALVDGDGEPLTGVPFELVGNQIISTGEIDRETHDSFSFHVRVSDGEFTTGPDQAFRDVYFYIGVENVDDAAPWDLSLYRTQPIDEEAPSGTDVGTLLPGDPDTFDASSFSYELIDSDGTFRLVVDQDGLTHLATNASLDRETAASHDVTVRVSDPSGGHYDKTFTIEVGDVNEAPIIEGGASKSIDVVPGATHNEVIYHIAASDPEGDELSYGVEFALDDGYFNFYVDDNGDLRFYDTPDPAHPDDGDEDGVYHLTVYAGDGDNYTYQDLTVTLPPAPSHAPVFNSDYVGNRIVNEGYDSVYVIAVDPDGDALSFSLLDSADKGRFTLSWAGSTVRLKFNSTTNFEAPGDADHDGVYNLLLGVSDGEHSTTATMAIHLADVNEFTPVITSSGGASSATVSVKENTTTVVQVKANDADGADELSYSLSGGTDRSKFTIDASTGVLSFIVPPNYESPSDANRDRTYSVVVKVSDGQRSDTQSLAIKLSNVNEAPVIGSNGGAASATRTVSENSKTVMTLTANDPDSGATRKWSLAGGADKSKFAINSKTGALTFVAAPNFEAKADANHDNVYDLIVKVTDNTGLSDTQTLAVTVTDVNEAVRITSNKAAASATISIRENVVPVTTFAASDPDAAAHLTWSLAGGDDRADFRIDAATGQLSFATNPDFEAPADKNRDNAYKVTVKVSDGHFTDTQALTIKVANDDGKAKTGGSASETLEGSSAEEKLDGKGGNDTINAGAGGDTIIGGSGTDELHGGTDIARDIFRFLRGESGTTEGNIDTVFDFVSGVDKIDLSGIDGDPAKGQQDLRLVSVFTPPGSKSDGQFRLAEAGDHVDVEIDADGDTNVDMVIRVMNVERLVAGDFML